MAVGVLATLFVGLLALVPFVLFKGGAPAARTVETPTARPGEGLGSESNPGVLPLSSDFSQQGPFLAYVPTIASFVRPMSATHHGLPREVMAFSDSAAADLRAMEPNAGHGTSNPATDGERYETTCHEEAWEPAASDTGTYRSSSCTGDILGGDGLLSELWEQDNRMIDVGGHASLAETPLETQQSDEVAFQREGPVADHGAASGLFQRILEENIELRCDHAGDAAA
jgi:hypothetical protein